jgi:hypothetical protein
MEEAAFDKVMAGENKEKGRGKKGGAASIG